MIMLIEKETESLIGIKNPLKANMLISAGTHMSLVDYQLTGFTDDTEESQIEIERLEKITADQEEKIKIALDALVAVPAKLEESEKPVKKKRGRKPKAKTGE